MALGAFDRAVFYREERSSGVCHSQEAIAAAPAPTMPSVKALRVQDAPMIHPCDDSAPELPTLQEVGTEDQRPCAAATPGQQCFPAFQYDPVARDSDDSGEFGGFFRPKFPAGSSHRAAEWPYWPSRVTVEVGGGRFLESPEDRAARRIEEDFLVFPVATAHERNPSGAKSRRVEFIGKYSFGGRARPDVADLYLPRHPWHRTFLKQTRMRKRNCSPERPSQRPVAFTFLTALRSRNRVAHATRRIEDDERLFVKRQRGPPHCVKRDVALAIGPEERVRDARHRA